MSSANLKLEFSSPPASPASFTSVSSSSSSAASELLCYSASSTDSGYPSPLFRLETNSRPSHLTESPATSPEVSCTPKPLLSTPHTRTIRRSFSRPSSSVGFPAFVNNMTFGFKEKDKSKPKTPKKSSSTVTTSTTPFPSADSIDASHSTASSSRTARLVSATLGRAKLQKKKSLASFLNTINQEASNSTINATTPSSSTISNGGPVAERSAARKGAFEDEEDDFGEVIAKFEVKDRLVWRHGVRVHPYGADAPYMQSYERMAIDNDVYAEHLVSKLNSSGTPTFHQYGKKPPATVLDLGCGLATWVGQAAEAWKQYGTIVTGFDMINLAQPILDEHDNTRFVQGNFVKYSLPFNDESFDLVRMANLSLCIPYDKWLFVFSEVKRVLSPKGRLELIDDQLFFPYGSPPSSIDGVMSPTTPTPKSFSTAPPRSGFDDADEASLSVRKSTDGDESDKTLFAASSLSLDMSTEEDESFDSASTLIDSDASTLTSARSSMQSNHSVIKKHLEATGNLPPTVELPPLTLSAPISFDTSDSKQDFPPPPTRPIPDIPIQEPVAIPISRSISSELLPITSALSPSDTITPLSACIDTPTPRPTPTPTESLDTPTPTQTQPTTDISDRNQIGDAEFASSGHPSTTHPEPLPDAYATWEQCSAASKDLEVVFERMLKEKFGIHPRPHEFILAALKTTFGDDNAEKIRSMHVRLAPPECNYDHELGVLDEADADGAEVQVDGDPKKNPFVMIRWDKKSKKERKAAKEAAKLVNMLESAPGAGDLFLPPTLPEGLSAKAASKLGISPSEFASAVAAAPNSHASPRPPSLDSVPSTTSTFVASGPVQSPGLIVLPSTFIPLSPSELEMHTCRHMHTLLECAPALREFVGGFTDERGRRICGDTEFEENVWEYECFRRQRFNWPSGTPDSDIDTSCDLDATSWTKLEPIRPSTASKSRPSSSSSASHYSRQTSYAPAELTHVRTVRVYGAMKGSDTITPIMMRSHSALPPTKLVSSKLQVPV